MCKPLVHLIAWNGQQEEQQGQPATAAPAASNTAAVAAADVATAVDAANTASSWLTAAQWGEQHYCVSQTMAREWTTFSTCRELVTAIREMLKRSQPPPAAARSPNFK
jgi:hypothetical protein